MGDFLAELFDQFDPEEQARITAAEDSTRGILAQGAAAVRDRLLAAGSPVLTDWALEPENDARADAAGVVFVAYVEALWSQTDPARSESIQEFGAKVDKLVDPVLTRYGWEGQGLIDELRWKCQMNASIFQSLLRTSTASTTPSTVDSGAGLPHDETDLASGQTDAANAAEQSEAETGQSGGADGPVKYIKPSEILQFSSDSWCKRKRQNADLNATYARRHKNWPDAERVENILRSARGWAAPVLRELVAEVQDVFELKQRVAKQAFDKFIEEKSYFWERYQEFASALWEEGWPSLEDHAIAAMAERATSAAKQTSKVPEPGASKQANPAQLGACSGEGMPEDSTTNPPSGKDLRTEFLQYPSDVPDQPDAAGQPEQNVERGPLPVKDAHVDLLEAILNKGPTTLEKWAKEHKLGRTTVFDWKALRSAGKSLTGKVSTEKSAEIEQAIDKEAKALGLRTRTSSD